MVDIVLSSNLSARDFDLGAEVSVRRGAIATLQQADVPLYTINRSSPVDIQMTIQDVLNGASPSIVGGAIRVPYAGVWELSGYVSFRAMSNGDNVSRTCLGFTWRTTGGAAVSPEYRDSYMRDQQGNDESGQALAPLVIAMDPAQPLKLVCRRVSGSTGNVIIDPAFGFHITLKEHIRY